MNTGLAVLGIILLLLCVLSFVIIRRNRQKRDQKFKETISSLAGESCNIDVYDGWKNTVIGLDNQNRKLFFVRETGDKNVRLVVDLSDIQFSKVINTRWTVNGASQSMTQKLALALTRVDRSRPLIQLEFYNADYDSLTMMDELQLAEKWSALINAAVSQERVLT